MATKLSDLEVGAYCNIDVGIRRNDGTPEFMGPVKVTGKLIDFGKIEVEEENGETSFWAGDTIVERVQSWQSKPGR